MGVDRHQYPVQEARAAKSVKTQLQSFRADMDKDGAAQRSESRRLVNGAVKRAQKLVDETLLVRWLCLPS